MSAREPRKATKAHRGRRRAGRPNKLGKSEQIAVRLPTELLRRIEAHAARLEDATPGLRISRADCVRILLTDAVQRAEADAEGE